MTPRGSRLPSGLRCTQGGARVALGGQTFVAGPDEGEGGTVNGSTRL